MKRMFAVVLLALAACARGTSTGPAIEATVGAMSLEVEAAGDTSVHFSGESNLQIVLSNNTRVPADLRFFSVAMSEPVTVGNVTFRAGFNLYGYDGSSSAIIPPLPAGTPATGLRSIAYLEITKPALLRYDHPGSNCIVTVAKHGKAGRLDCAKLTSQGGKAISLRMTWGGGA